MPEIGATLREARMRAKIDITEVEDATKIRAKYLRALENEEWNLLPGSTFVKSFLREYAQFLGLDGRLLVEEYKLRFEHPSEQELMPIAPALGRDRRRGGPGAGSATAPRWAITGVLLLILLAALFTIGKLGGGGGSDSGGGIRGAATTRTTPTRTTTTTPSAAPRTRAGVRIVPTGPLYVCLVDDQGRVLIPGTTFAAGQTIPVYRARSMRLTLGNNQVRLRVNGKQVPVPASSTAIAYELTPNGVRRLAASAAPTCT